MPMVTNSHLRISWLVITGLLAVATVVPSAALHDGLLNSYINSDWLRFGAYAVVGAIPIVAWRKSTGIAVALSVAILSINLQFLRGMTHGQGLDMQGTVINLLGIAAGILIGLHIRRFDEEPRHNFTSSRTRARSTPR